MTSGSTDYYEDGTKVKYGWPDETDKILSVCSPVCGHTRCCNCGYNVSTPHRKVVMVHGSYAVCSEGCAIQVWTRGRCCTDSNHPWEMLLEWEKYAYKKWPELRIIRERIAKTNETH